MYGCCPLVVSYVRGSNLLIFLPPILPIFQLVHMYSRVSVPIGKIESMERMEKRSQEEHDREESKKGRMWKEERIITHPGPPIINLPPSPVPINVDGSSVSVFVDFAFNSLSSFSRFVIYYQPLLSIYVVK